MSEQGNKNAAATISVRFLYKVLCLTVRVESKGSLKDLGEK